MNIRAHALILRADRQGEADRLLTLFTEELGKVKALARSADKPKSKWAGCVFPFAEIEADLYSKREGAYRYTLTQCQTIDAHADLRTSLEAMGAAAALCETVDGLVPDKEALPEVWELAREGLHRVETGPSRGCGLLAFTLRLLGLLGLAPRLDGCIRCNKPYPTGKPARWSGAEGGLVCRTCLDPGTSAVEIPGESMGLLLCGLTRSLAENSRLDPTPAALRAALNAVYMHTEFHADWRPKTLAWLDSVSFGE